LHRLSSSNIIVRCGNFSPGPQSFFHVEKISVRVASTQLDRRRSSGLLASPEIKGLRPSVKPYACHPAPVGLCAQTQDPTLRLALNAARRQSHSSTSRHSLSTNKQASNNYRAKPTTSTALHGFTATCVYAIAHDPSPRCSVFCKTD
jgi:hypothetical protein